MCHDAGELEAETAALLEMEKVSDVEFSPEVLACLPKENEAWSISPQERAYRRDFTNIRCAHDQPVCWPPHKDLLVSGILALMLLMLCWTCCRGVIPPAEHALARQTLNHGLWLKRILFAKLLSPD